MRGPGRLLLATAVAAALLPAGTVGAAGPAGAAGAVRPLDDVQVLTRVGTPGQPEGVAVARDGTVYVGTHNYERGDAAAPSEVLAHAPDGRLLRRYVVRPASSSHGLLGMALDRRGDLYVLDHDPSRLLRLDVRTGRVSTYATFADLPRCAVAPGGPCSDTATDLAAFGNSLVFAPDGTAYVTDLQQATVWRVPPGGGPAQVWLTDRRLDSNLGPNGIALRPGDRTLVLAMTAPLPGLDGATLPTGKLYEVDLQPDGGPGPLQTLWEARPGDFPDGFALGASSNAYVALAGGNGLAVVSPGGVELRRFTAPGRDARGEVPWDAPASVAFTGTRVLVTNQSFVAEDPTHWAVLDVEVGEPGQPLHLPAVPRSRPTAPR